jgi:signal transduction histidine kinase
VEFRFRRRDGKSIWVESNGPFRISVADDSGLLALVSIDVTERHTLEESLRQMQKMEAVGLLAGGVAHDFNNLLTVINGYVELAAEELPAGHPAAEALEHIEQAGRRATALTRQLLAFSRKQILKPEVLNLNHLVANMEKMLQRLIGEHIELQTILNSELGNLNADPSQLEQVIMNLCINARDAMPDGGTLIIYTENVHLNKSNESNYYDAAPGAYIKLSISDTGTGMDEKLRSQVFEPFFTTKEKGKGTGLGLSTVYGIIKQSGGTIWVESEIGKGTTFNMLFPRSTESIENDFDAHSDLLDVQGSETILVVEDEDALRTLTVEMLEENGYTVLKAEDGEAALSISIKYNRRIDLLLTDVVMPKMNGRKLAEEIVKMHPEIFILYRGTESGC